MAKIINAQAVRSSSSIYGGMYGGGGAGSERGQERQNEQNPKDGVFDVADFARLLRERQQGGDLLEGLRRSNRQMLKTWSPAVPEEVALSLRMAAALRGYAK